MAGKGVTAICRYGKREEAVMWTAYCKILAKCDSLPGGATWSDLNTKITSLHARTGVASPSVPAKAKADKGFHGILEAQQELRNRKNDVQAKVFLGEISSQKRTVSELLMADEQLRASTWEILSSPRNRGKEYTNIQPGTRIYYDGDDGSLSWSSQNVDTDPAVTDDPADTLADQEVGPAGRQPAAMTLGVLTEKSPTISHLLKAHADLAHATWSILSSPVNSAKDFTDIPVGTTVTINALTREISWSAGRDRSVASAAGRQPEAGAENFQAAAPSQGTAADGAATGQPLGLQFLGTIDEAHPTVSHLLISNPQLRDQVWELLADSRNSSKPFAEIGVGTAIYFDTATREISWQQAQRAATPVPTAYGQQKPASSPAETMVTLPAGDLSEAVQPYLGTSYKEINCYELLVKGLRRMEIPYEGKNGLFSKLTRMAQDKGMPANAYLNGEGIVRAAGSLVLSKSYTSVRDWEKESASLYRELEPLLNKGQILSFSTERRGHTGIVSQQEGHWTFINSGRLDNPITSTDVSKGVGEESLQKEINNWFKLAHGKRESLLVTLGSLDQKKIVTAYNPESSPTRRI